MTVHVLLVDNFDSFTFNLVSELRRRAAVVQVYRNDVAGQQLLERALGLPRPSLLAISPGPGAPRDAGCCLELVRRAQGRIPIFGVCLGHQAIVEALGGRVGFAGQVIHGKAWPVTHEGAGLLAGLPSPFLAGRYHSLAAQQVPAELRVTARAGSVVMAVEHETLPIAGVQFHPESILTPEGGVLVDNVLAWAAGFWAARTDAPTDAPTDARTEARAVARTDSAGERGP